MKHDELLHLYQEELAYMYRLCAEFSTAHPKIAGRLRLGPNSIEDPEIARLIQTVSLSNARIRHRLEDDFPEISEAMLQMLHPNALAPIPAMAITKFHINKEKLLTTKTIPADTTLLSENINGQPCQFKTRYPTQLLPLEITEAKLSGKPTTVPIVSSLKDCPGVLRIRLDCTHPRVTINTLGIDHLRFFINAPAPHAQTLYGLLFHHAVGIVIAHAPTDVKPLAIDPKIHLQPVGFSEAEGMLPYNKRTFMGYRLISEYFAFPEKFLFFDLIDLMKIIPQKFTAQDKHLELFIYLQHCDPTLEKIVNADFFALGCTPIVNLFKEKAEPITFVDTQTEYHLTPNSQYPPESREIYSVTQVVATDFEGEKIKFLPFYRLKHEQNKTYYHVTRKPTWEAGNYPLQGMEIFLSFINKHMNHFSHKKLIVNTDLLCTNRDSPQQLTFDNDAIGLKLESLMPDAIARISCVTRITYTRHPFSQQGKKWRYVSHLALNHLSTTHDEDGIESLRGLLTLYNFDESSEHLDLLAGLMYISSHTSFIRTPSNISRGSPLWHGVEVNLTIDEAKLNSASLYLFGTILNHFFRLYITRNLYSQLVIRNQQKEIYRFSPLSGYKSVI